MRKFERAGAMPFGVNPASVESHAKYAGKMAFGFPLLSDAGHLIAEAYHTVKPIGLGIQRTVYLVRRDGTIAFAARGAPSADEILAGIEP